MELRGWNAADFASEDIPEPPYLLDPILPSGGLAIVFGKGGHGKTQFAFTLARSLCDGASFLGRYEATKTRVSYLGVDMPIRMLQKRVRGFLGEFECPESLQILPSDSRLNILRLEESAVAPVLRHRPGLVIVDTLRKVHELDEDKSSTVATVFGAFRRLLGPDPAILFIHHDRKSRQDEDLDDPDSLNATVRGSVAWTTDSDLTVHCRKVRAMGGPVIEVTFPRFRYSEDEPPIVCRMNRESFLLDPIEPPGSKQEALELAKQLWADHSDWDRSDVTQALVGAGVERSYARRCARMSQPKDTNSSK